jgi:hypothetical protein
VTGQPERGATIFLTGPPGSGKTTTALLWSVQRERPTFAIDIDAMCSVLDVAGDLQGHPPLDAEQRYLLAGRVIAVQAERITATGIDCVVAAPRVPTRPEHPESWRHQWNDLDRLLPITVVLLPDVSVCLERNVADAARRGPFAVDAATVRLSYTLGWERWRADPRAAVIDTSTMTPADVVAAVEEAVTALR